MSAALTFDDIARLVRLHDELIAADRLADAAVVRQVVLAHEPSTPPTDESLEARRRRQARERQQRARDRRAGSVTERDVLRDASRIERDARSVTQRDVLRDASRVTLRDDSVTLRDVSHPIRADHIAQPVAGSAVSESAPEGGERDASVTRSVTERDVLRDASRCGGLGGVVAVAVGSSLFNTEISGENTEKPRARERDDLRDASRSITLHRTDRSRRVAAMPTATSILDRPELARTSARLSALTSNTSSRASAQRIAAELVYRYWVAKLGKARTMLSPERERVILRRLAENDGNASELCWAIDGLTRSAWHMGRNDAGQKHDDLTVVLRDRTQLEKFAGAMTGWRNGEEHPFVRDASDELTAAAPEAPAFPLILTAEVSHA